MAELILEAALEGVRDELPHSIAVVVEDMSLRAGRPEDRPLLDVYANLFVERESQKSIVIGTRGSRLKDVGSRARRQIEALLGTPVYLDLRVKLAKDWQRDPKQLRRLGFCLAQPLPGRRQRPALRGGEAAAPHRLRRHHHQRAGGVGQLRRDDLRALGVGTPR